MLRLFPKMSGRLVNVWLSGAAPIPAQVVSCLLQCNKVTYKSQLLIYSHAGIADHINISWATDMSGVSALSINSISLMALQLIPVMLYCTL